MCVRITFDRQELRYAKILVGLCWAALRCVFLGGTGKISEAQKRWKEIGKMKEIKEGIDR